MKKDIVDKRLSLVVEIAFEVRLSKTKLTTKFARQQNLMKQDAPKKR